MCLLCPHSKKDCFTIVPVLVRALKQDGEKLEGQSFSKYLMDPANLFVLATSIHVCVCLAYNFHTILNMAISVGVAKWMFSR